jgi:DNA-directed RNA polymerase subunit M/transcription elongation factor TFIIS
MLTVFCETCDNHMDIKWHDENPKNEQDKEKYMILYCKKCGNTEILKKENFYEIDEVGNQTHSEETGTYSPLIYKKNYENSQIDTRLFNNEFIIHDKTLPFVNDEKIKCPKCLDQNNKQEKIVYQIYDNDNMKFLYTCTNCRTSWTIN